MKDKIDNPRHIAFIMDGNGRWAESKGLPRNAGHRKGVERVKEIVKAASELGIEVVTFFAFSNENWQRPRREIEVLMRLLDSFLNRQIRLLEKNNIRFMVIGRANPIPDYLWNKILEAQERTKNNTGLTMVLALNYGSRQEILDAVKKFTSLVVTGKAKIEDLNEETFSSYLYTHGLPDPDLLIRTSGEMRISNFLLWQISYAELYFPKKYWPDFDTQEFERAIKIFLGRERRFGRINVDKENN